MQKKLQKWSNNQTAKIFVENEQIIMQKIKKHKTMKERLQNFEGQYEFKEWDTGKSIGNEVL